MSSFSRTDFNNLRTEAFLQILKPVWLLVDSFLTSRDFLAWYEATAGGGDEVSDTIGREVDMPPERLEGDPLRSLNLFSSSSSSALSSNPSDTEILPSVRFMVSS